MVDEILQELWKTKDALGQEAQRNLQLFCDRLNAEARRRGAVLVNGTTPSPGQVCEETSEYKTRADDGFPAGS